VAQDSSLGRGSAAPVGPQIAGIHPVIMEDDLCETWVPRVPTDQAHGRPRQVGQATRPYLERPRDLACKTRHRWIPTKQIDVYGRCCNLYLCLPVITDQESGNRPCPLASIRRVRRPLYNYAILKQSTPTTGRRVLLSGGPNHYKPTMFLVFRVLVCNLRVLSIRFHLAEQLNHRD
jgi:hypothetical protein